MKIVKIVKDEDLSYKQKFIMDDAKKFSHSILEIILDHINNNFVKNDKFYNLDHSLCVSYILKIFSLIFMNGISIANEAGKKFDSVENNKEELFDEIVEAMKIAMNFKKIKNKNNNYNNTEIKRIDNVSKGQSKSFID